MGEFLDSVIMETCNVTGAAYRGALKRRHKRLCGPGPKPRHRWEKGKNDPTTYKTRREYLADLGISFADGNPFLDDTIDLGRRIAIITGGIQGLETEDAESVSRNQVEESHCEDAPQLAFFF